MEIESMVGTQYGPADALPVEQDPEAPAIQGNKVFAALDQGVYAALETYSNVHRGSGHNSLVSTHLYEQARDMVLEHLELDSDRYAVVFCTPRRAETLIARLKHKSYRLLSSQAIGLPLGIRALAVERKALPGLTRISLGIENSAAEIDTLIHALAKIARQPPGGADNPFAPTQTNVGRQMEEFARAVAQRVYT